MMYFVSNIIVVMNHPRTYLYILIYIIPFSITASGHNAPPYEEIRHKHKSLADFNQNFGPEYTGNPSGVGYDNLTYENIIMGKK